MTVLGASIAGLAAAATAREDGHRCIVYEAAPAEGLLDAIESDGYQFDQAVQVSLADRSSARQVFDQTPDRIFHPQPRRVDHPHVASTYGRARRNGGLDQAGIDVVDTQFHIHQ